MPLTQPPHDCPLCPRVVAFREEARRLHPDWYNNPVPYWGDEAAKLIIIGLAPGLKGANRTGRPFTGDYAGDLLYATLLKLGLAMGQYQQQPDDSLRLRDTLIVNGVACVPPENEMLWFCAYPVRVTSSSQSVLKVPSDVSRDASSLPAVTCC